MLNGSNSSGFVGSIMITVSARRSGVASVIEPYSVSQRPPSGTEVFEIPQPALRRRRVLDHIFSIVEGQNARNVCPALFDGGLHAQRGHLETVTQVRSDV